MVAYHYRTWAPRFVNQLKLLTTERNNPDFVLSLLFVGLQFQFQDTVVAMRHFPFYSKLESCLAIHQWAYYKQVSLCEMK